MVYADGSGTPQQLTGKIFPEDAHNKNIYWVTEDPRVALVDETGIVTPTGPGETTITAYARDNPEESDSCTVYVFGEPSVVPNAVVLDQILVTLVADQESRTQKLNAGIIPETATNKEVTWGSSNPSVVTVDQTGVLTPREKGTATITVTTQKGLRRAYCRVTVLDRLNPATHVDIVPQVLRLVEEGSSGYLKEVISPAAASDREVSWVSDNPSIARVDQEGRVTPLSPGRAVITAVLESDNSIMGTSLVRVAQAWAAEETVEPDKTWRVTFNSPVQEGQDLKEHFQVLDDENQPREIEIHLEDQGRTAAVTPASPLSPGDYQLRVEGTLKDTGDNLLERPVRFYFSVD